MKLEDRMLQSIKRRTSSVVLRSDFANRARASQVTEVLNNLQKKGVLIRIGTGVYSKTRKSSITGAIIPAGSLETLSVEVFKRMKINVRPGRAATEYNSGATTLSPIALHSL